MGWNGSLEVATIHEIDSNVKHNNKEHVFVYLPLLLYTVFTKYSYSLAISQRSKNSLGQILLGSTLVITVVSLGLCVTSSLIDNVGAVDSLIFIVG